MADYAANHGSLTDLQHEIAVYQHLHEEQGVSVPRFFAHGWIKQTTCYFLAVELLGPTLEDATEADQDAFQSAAVEALECIHARGVLHRSELSTLMVLLNAVLQKSACSWRLLRPSSCTCLP